MNYQIFKVTENSNILLEDGEMVGIICEVDFIYHNIITIWVKRPNVPGMRYIDVSMEDIAVA